MATTVRFIGTIEELMIARAVCRVLGLANSKEKHGTDR